MRAIGWDHPRCIEPMLAAAEAWRARTGVTIAWEFRSLADFNDQPVHELVDAYDLLVIDHPAIAEAVAYDALAPLDALLPAERLARLVDEAVGPSGRSYAYAGRTWALAVDAACQVSAHQPQQLVALGEAPPATWPDVLRLARRAPGRVGLPLLPADALCALLSIAATLGDPVTIDGGIPVHAVEVLAELAPRLHPDSWTSAPPQMLVRMAGGEDGVGYIPLTFGYRGLAGGALRFGDAPAAPGGLPAPILGGAGIAVSAASRDARLAAAFAAWLCEAETQRRVVLAHGGQPGHRSIWLRPGHTPAATFFPDTRSSMEHAYVRPAHPAWPAFHRDAGADLAAGLRAGEPAARTARRLQERLDAVRAAA